MMELELLKLLYQSLRALGNESIPHKLTRCIFELKSIMINGEFDVRLITEDLLNPRDIR